MSVTILRGDCRTVLPTLPDCSNEKPVGLLGRLLRKLPPGVIGDPFMGSGSTGEAAVRSGRGFVGCEVDARYFEIARQRIEEATRQSTLFPAAAAVASQEAML